MGKFSLFSGLLFMFFVVNGKTIKVPQDTKTIQEAINKSQAGDTVLVSPGEYREAIFFKSGITLRGTDKDRCILAPLPNSAAIICALNCKSGTISNLTFHGTGKEDNKLYCLGIDFRMINGKFCIENIKKDSPAAKAGIPLKAKFVSLNNITNHPLALYHFAQVRKASKVTLKLLIDNKVKEYVLETKLIESFGRWPDGVASVASPLNIEKCTFENLSSAISIIKNPMNTISNNFFNSNIQALYTFKVSNIIFKSNIIKNCKDNAVFIDSSKGKITGNKFENNYSGIISFHSNSYISDNVCINNQKHGIFSESSNDIIKNNKCNSNKSCGIFVVSGKTEILQNTCSKNAHGIALNLKATANIKNNTCKENSSTGIFMSHPETSAQIDNNLCSNNNVGISYVFGAQGQASNNRCLNNKSYGILILAKGTKAKVLNNICNNNNDSGIVCNDGAFVLIKNNTCQQNKQAGIFLLKKCTGSIIDNVCKDNKIGILLYKKDTMGKISKNTCSSNRLHGIYIGEGASAVINSNVCNNNSNSGITMGQKSSGTVEKNTCNNNKYGFCKYKCSKSKISKKTNHAKANSEADFDLK